MYRWLILSVFWIFAVEAQESGFYRNTESFKVDGIQVILKQTPGKPLISAGLYIRGGSVELPPELLGIQEVLGDVLYSGGSQKHPNEAFSLALDQMGTSFQVDAQKEVTVFELTALRKYWGPSFELFKEILFSPLLPEAQIELAKARQIETIKAMPENPNRYMSILGTALLFEHHPYEKRTWGTEESIRGLDRTKLQAYVQEQWVKSKMLFVIVGDISREEVQQAIHQGFGSLPEGDWKAPKLSNFEDHEARLKSFEKKTLPTDYLIAFFKAPSPLNKDYEAMVMATEILSSRLFEKIRTKLNLSYGVGSGMRSATVNYGYIYMTSPHPNLAYHEILDEIDALQNWKVNEGDLKDHLSTYITEYYMKLETLGAQRALLAHGELVMGGWKRAIRISGLRRVRAEDIRRVAQKYFKNFQIGFYGNTDRLDKDLVLADPIQAEQLLLKK